MKNHAHRVRLAAAVVVTLMLLACFLNLAIGDRLLGFRDAANYYHPLFDWQSTEWAAGRIPLWNPHDGTGAPSLAQTSSSALYPAKLLFACPLSIEHSYHLYIMGHLILAIVGAIFAARSAGGSLEGSVLCGVSYGFAGSVVFQCYNVVFLVGAAWLPVAVLAIERIVVHRSTRACVGLAIVLAMMTLGGDPQAAYHAGLLSILYAVLVAPRTPCRERGYWIGGRLLLLSTAAALGLLLSAAQVIPAVEWTRHSDRSMYDSPRNVYEAIAEQFRSSDEDSRSPLSRLFDEPIRGSHHASSYQFSVPPGELLSLLWPNVYGDIFPVNTRWSLSSQRPNRIWVPTFYLGLLPLVLAISSWRIRTTDRRIQWLTWSTIGCLLASLGWFGIGWLIETMRQTFTSAAPNDPRIAPQVGGVYWMMATFLPGYASFRYPAKLMVVASLLLSLAAAAGWDKLHAARLQRFRSLLVAAFVLTAAASCLWLLSADRFPGWVSATASDPLFGPLQIDLARRQVGNAILHSAVALVLFWAILRFVQPGWRQKSLLLLVAAADLTVANHQLIATVPAASIRGAPDVVARLSEAEKQQWRILRQAVKPPSRWKESASFSRLEQVVSWEHESLHPRYHLPAGVSLIESRATMNPKDLKIVSQVRRDNLAMGDLYDSLSVGLTLLPVDEGGEPNSAEFGRFRLDHSTTAFPRAWLVQDFLTLPSLRSHRPAELAARTRRIFFTGGKVRDLRRMATVESDSVPFNRSGMNRLSERGNSAPDTTAGICFVNRTESQSIGIYAECHSPTLMVLNDLWYPGWRASVSSDSGLPHETPIYRTNRIMRGILLPAGRHRITFVYQPHTFRWGLITSGIAWTALFGWLIWTGWHGTLLSRKR